MADEVRLVEAEHRHEAQIVDDHVLHAGEMRRGAALTKAGVMGQVDAKAVGEPIRPLMALERRGAVKSQDGGPLSDRLDGRVDAVDVECERLEIHLLLLRTTSPVWPGSPTRVVPASGPRKCPECGGSRSGQ